MGTKQIRTTRDRPVRHHLLLAVGVGAATAAWLAIPWPWDLAAPATLGAGLVLLARFGRRSPDRTQGSPGFGRALGDDLARGPGGPAAGPGPGSPGDPAPERGQPTPVAA